MHEQVIIKANIPVDRGVVPLVEALNASPKILTVNSCEADEQGRPYVDFLFGSGCAELVGFVDTLANKLAPIGGYTLCIEWFGEDPQPRGRLTVSNSHLADVAAVVKELVVSYDRTNQSVCGTLRIEPPH